MNKLYYLVLNVIIQSFSNQKVITWVLLGKVAFLSGLLESYPIVKSLIDIILYPVIVEGYDNWYGYSY